MQMKQLGRRPVKSERRSLGTGATQREGVRGGSVTLPQFILSFILRHRPIFEVSDFPMLLGFRFSTDRIGTPSSVYQFVLALASACKDPCLELREDGILVLRPTADVTNSQQHVDTAAEDAETV